MIYADICPPPFFFFGVFFSFSIAYYVAFGPHGPRAPVNPPGTTVKILTGVSALIGAAGLLYAGFRSIGTFCFFVFVFFSQFKIKKTLLSRRLRHSPGATQDDHQGVGRGQQRACQGTQNQPHLRSVTLSPPHGFFFPGP